MNYTTNFNKSQENLKKSLSNGQTVQTVQKNRKFKKYRQKKFQSLQVAESFQRLGEVNRAVRIKHCADSLGFIRLADGRHKLAFSDYCRERLCPACSWRRSLKTFADVSAVMDIIGGKYWFLFLTLTIPNCPAVALDETIKKLLYDYKRLTQCVDYRRAVMGCFRALEVTYNRERGDFHPHLHCILAVPPHYFSDPRIYIRQTDWVKLWTCITGYSRVNVDIRAFTTSTDNIDCTGTDSTKKAICECSKYTVKTSDLIARLDSGGIDEELTDFLVNTMHGALRGKRLIAYGGIMRKVHMQLQDDFCAFGLDKFDVSYKVDRDILRDELVELSEWYRWGVGFEGYNYYASGTK